jgi:protein involved in polysaccharide export with SLBB domain
VIEPPDILLIRGSARLSRAGQPLDGQRLVRPDGTISLGAAGAVSVAGLSTDQAADAIARQLTRAGAVQGLSPEQVRDELTVEVVAYNSKVFYVITDLAGQGEQVYRFPSSGDQTVLDVVAQVNGLPAVAGRCRVWVERRDGGAPPKVLPVDMRGITQRGEARTNYALRPGDRVHFESEGTGGPAPGGAAGRRPAEGDVDRQLRWAFGDGGEALAAPIKVEVRSRRLGLAANTFSVQADGRVRLAPCWLVRSVGEPGGAEAPEGVALHCREAFLTVDGPVRSPADISRHVTAVELVGDVRLTFLPGAPRKGGRTSAALQ